MTLHRPANVDDKKRLVKIINMILENMRGIPLIFPVHPRTARILESIKFKNSNFHQITPLTYLEFNFLVERSKAIITDSGGITEEATIFKTPCITLRNNTERPETVTIGTNELVGNNLKKLNSTLDKLFLNQWKKSSIPELWDGNTGERIVSKIIEINDKND